VRKITIDIETSGTEYGCFIYQIAALVWDENGIIADFEGRMMPSEKIGYDFNKKTMSWWMNQPKEVYFYVTGGKESVHKVLTEFRYFLYENIDEDTAIWTHAAFDIPLLKYFYKMHGMWLNIPTFAQYDIRTIQMLYDSDRKIVNGIKKKIKGLHDAKSDCEYHMKYVNKLIYNNEKTDKDDPSW
jgi:hypothetical protein